MALARCICFVPRLPLHLLQLRLPCSCIAAAAATGIDPLHLTLLLHRGCCRYCICLAASVFVVHRLLLLLLRLLPLRLLSCRSSAAVAFALLIADRL
jgi:hypothetical protein